MINSSIGTDDTTELSYPHLTPNSWNVIPKSFSMVRRGRCKHTLSFSYAVHKLLPSSFFSRPASNLEAKLVPAVGQTRSNTITSKIRTKLHPKITLFLKSVITHN